MDKTNTSLQSERLAMKEDAMHCKKSYRQIPTYKPDDARPNDQADGICLQQACRTFPIYFNTKVGLFWQVPSPKSDFSDSSVT
jgi:hypothetical protein